jgi:hypothetical protein
MATSRRMLLYSIFGRTYYRASLSDRKGRKKTDALPMPHSIKEETSDATKEDCPDE